jgi:RimJ/RimL family protein N-acetyltransferase
MYFAETKSLRIRGVQDSDLDKLVALYNDPRSSRTGLDYVVPQNEVALRKKLEEQTQKSLMYCILETKEPLEDGSNWAGATSIWVYRSPKNRDVALMIGLDAKFWGKGYGTYSNQQETLSTIKIDLVVGTEAMRWIVTHAFEQLDMHRITLFVVEDNPRAIALYQNL